MIFQGTKIRKGDHIIARRNPLSPFGGQRPLYEHHGIYVGKGRVVHFTTRSGFLNTLVDFGTKAVIRETSIYEFADGDTVSVVRYPASSVPFSKWEVMRRARSVVGSAHLRYNLFKCNCEHLASFIKTGRMTSKQVEFPANDIADIAKGLDQLLADLAPG